MLHMNARVCTKVHLEHGTAQANEIQELFSEKRVSGVIDLWTFHC